MRLLLLLALLSCGDKPKKEPPQAQGRVDVLMSCSPSGCVKFDPPWMKAWER